MGQFFTFHGRSFRMDRRSFFRRAVAAVGLAGSAAVLNRTEERTPRTNPTPDTLAADFPTRAGAVMGKAMAYQRDADLLRYLDYGYTMPTYTYSTTVSLPPKVNITGIHVPSIVEGTVNHATRI